MANHPEYKFLEDSLDPGETCPVQITSGEFEGVVFRYGKISLNELDNGELNVTMDVTIIQSPEGFDKDNQKFTNAVGEIFSHIVETGVETQINRDPVDLEDDVHQDN